MIEARRDGGVGIDEGAVEIEYQASDPGRVERRLCCGGEVAHEGWKAGSIASAPVISFYPSARPLCDSTR